MADRRSRVETECGLRGEVRKEQMIAKFLMVTDSSFFRKSYF